MKLLSIFLQTDTSSNSNLIIKTKGNFYNVTDEKFYLTSLFVLSTTPSDYPLVLTGVENSLPLSESPII